MHPNWLKRLVFWFYFVFFLAALCSLRNFSSLTRD